MSKRQDLVKNWLKEAKKNKITSAYLAKKLSMSLQNFYYHVNESPELDLDIFNNIKSELKKFITIQDDHEVKYPIEFESKKELSSLNKYPIVTEVFAGESMAIYISENITEYGSFDYHKKENCFIVKVIGNSMNGVVHDGETILVDMDQPLSNDCVVIVRLKDGRQLIKRYRVVNDELVMFSSDSPGYQPIIVKKEEIEAIYKVVGSYRRFQ